jgi:adenosylhomocysteine nucleosidase
LVTVAGVGAGRARVAAARLLREGATALVSWGYAGALDPGLRAGTLLLPEAITTEGGQLLSTDAAWRDQVLRLLGGRLPVHSGMLLQAERLIRTPDEKRVLYQRVGAVAVDMESAALAESAQRAAVPFLALRAVSDTANLGIPASVMQAVDATGRVRMGRLLLGLLVRPLDFVPLLRLGIGFRAAQATLAELARDASPASLEFHSEPSG